MGESTVSTGVSGKMVHLEVIRILAVCLVVLNHTDVYFLYFSETSHPATYAVSLFASVLCRINVPLFFMVSGALLLKKKESIRELYRKRVARMLAVLVLFSAVQYLAAGFLGDLDGGMGAADFFSRLYTGQVLDSYWFLYAYLGVLIALPFLRKLAWGMEEAEFRYLFALKVLFDIVFRLAAVYTGDTVRVEALLVTDPVFYLFAGYYMEWVADRKLFVMRGMRKGLPAALCILLVFGSMGLVYLEYRVKGVYTQDCLGIFAPFLTIIVYGMVKSFCGRHVLPERMQHAVLYLGSTVFGVYLVEKLVRKQLLPLYLYLCGRTVGLAACLVYVAGTLVLSVVYVSIGKKIPFLKRLL